MRVLKKLGSGKFGSGKSPGKGERPADPAHVVVEPAKETNEKEKWEEEKEAEEIEEQHCPQEKES